MLEYWRTSLGRWARYKDNQGSEVSRFSSVVDASKNKHLGVILLRRRRKYVNLFEWVISRVKDGKKKVNPDCTSLFFKEQRIA